MKNTSKISYNEAVQEIEKIISSIESEELDIDKLENNVKTALELIKLCRKKLKTTEESIKKELELMDDGE